MTFHHVFPQVSRFPGIRYHPQVGRQKIQKNASCWGRQLESHPLIECRPWENHLTVAEIHYSYIYISYYIIYTVYISYVLYTLYYINIYLCCLLYKLTPVNLVFFQRKKKRFEKAPKKKRKKNTLEKKNRKKAIGKKKRQKRRFEKAKKMQEKGHFRICFFIDFHCVLDVGCSSVVLKHGL